MSKPCKISARGCVYHACMSDDCQKEEMNPSAKFIKEYGRGKCEEKKVKCEDCKNYMDTCPGTLNENGHCVCYYPIKKHSKKNNSPGRAL
jgi:hypothetical protein